MSAAWHRGCQLAEKTSEARTVFKETLLAHDTAIRALQRQGYCSRDSEMFAVISGKISLTQDGLKITPLFRCQT